MLACHIPRYLEQKHSGLVYFTGEPWERQRGWSWLCTLAGWFWTQGARSLGPRSELFLEATLLLLEALPRAYPFTLQSVKAKNSDCEDRPCGPYADRCRLCIEMGRLTALCLSVPVCAVSTVILLTSQGCHEDGTEDSESHLTRWMSSNGPPL